jgi:hypothetical protein
MFVSDRKIIEVKEKKNELEQYVYDNRAWLSEDGNRFNFIEPVPREAFVSHLNEVESWLYDQGANVSKEEY